MESLERKRGVLLHDISLTTALTASLSNLGNESSFKIWSIDPLHRNPEFILIHEQVWPGNLWGPRVCLNEPVVVVKDGHSLYVYNWAEGTGCQWEYTAVEPSSKVSGPNIGILVESVVPNIFERSFSAKTLSFRSIRVTTSSSGTYPIEISFCPLCLDNDCHRF